DQSAKVREHAIRLAGPRLDASPKLLEHILPLGNDSIPRICFQLGFTLGETKDARAVPMLAGIAKRYASDQWIRTAVLSSAAETADRVFIELLRDAKFAESPQGIGLLTELAHIVGARGHAPD